MAELSASARGWGSGWPHCQSSKIKTLRRSDGVVLPVRQEILEIVAFLANETERRGYNLKPGQCWGYACRAIRGSHTASNHSWGLAVDLNAPSNPMGSRLITDMPRWMIELWEAHMFRWGGSYRTRPDAMHHEFMGTPADAARITANIRRGTAPVTAAASLPIYFTGHRPYTENLLVVATQININKWIAKHKPRGILPIAKIDGVYGPNTAAHIVAFKKWVIKFQKDFHLPVWPNADTTIGPITMGALDFWANN